MSEGVEKRRGRRREEEEKKEEWERDVLRKQEPHLGCGENTIIIY